VKKTLYVQVLSGWQLPKLDRKPESKKGDVIDPYVIVQLVGLPADQATFKTKFVKNNGFNPIWRGEKKFPITNPDLDVLIFTVWDRDVATSDDFIAQYTLPVNSIRPGIRSVPLRDSQGHFYEHASLLAMAHDTRISFCVSMIGCADYKSMMQKRKGVDMKKHFTSALNNLVSFNDPVNNIAAFNNKHIFLAQGSADQLVPADCNKEFYEFVKGVAKDVILKLYPVGHTVPPEMEKDGIEWITALVLGPSKL